MTDWVSAKRLENEHSRFLRRLSWPCDPGRPGVANFSLGEIAGSGERPFRSRPPGTAGAHSPKQTLLLLEFRGLHGIIM